METRANYVAIGAFVLIVIAGLLGAVWWLYRSSQPGATETVRIVFPEPITGLSNGGSVLFNGIRVGEVVNLHFEPSGGDNVIAIARINPNAPIKTDTVAKLGFQGLTGVAYISLTGGSESAPSLFAEEEEDGKIPTINADTSAFTNVLDTAQSVLARLNTTLEDVNGILSTNRNNVNAVVADARTFANALAQTAPQISGLVSDVADASRALAGAAPHIASVVETANNLLSAIEPQRVETIVTNVETFTAALPGIGEKADTIVGTVNGLVTRLDDAASTIGEAVGAVRNIVDAIDAQAVSEIVTNVASTTKVFSDRATEIGTFVDDVSTIAGDVKSVTGTLASRQDKLGQSIDDASAVVAEAKDALAAAKPAIENAGKLIAAVSPESVTAIVDNVQKVTASLASETDAFRTLITSATQAAEGIDSVATLISSRDELISATLDDAAKLVENLRSASDSAPGLISSAESLLSNADAAVKAVDADAINKVVTSLTTFADALAAQSGNVETITTGLASTIGHADQIAASLAERLPLVESILNDAAATTHSVRTVADRLPAIADELQPAISNVSAALQAIDPAAITAIVNDARTFADALSAESANIQTITTGLTSTIGHADQIAASLAERLPLVESILNDAAATTHSVRTVADRLPAIADELQPAISNVSAALQAIDPAAITAIVNDARTFADALSAESANIQTITTGLTSTIGHADQIAASLAERLPMVESILNDAAATTHSVRTVADRLPAIADELQPAIANVSAALEAIDPTAITAIVDEVRRVAEAIGAQAPKFETIVANVDATASDARAIAASTRGITDELSTRREAIGGMIDDARATVSNARVASDALPGIIDTLRPGIDNAASVLSAIDPEAVRSITTSAQTFMDGLAAQREPLAELIRSANVSLGHVETITTDISGRMPEINAMIDRASAALTSIQSAADQLPGFADTLRPGLQNVADVLASIDQEAVNKIVSDVSAFTDMLAAERETVSSILTRTDSAMARVETITSSFAQRTPQIGAIIDRVEATVTSAQSFADQLPGFADTVRPGLQNLSEVLQAIDPEAISTIVTDVGRLSSTLAAEAPRVSTIISSVETTAHDVEAIAAQVRGELGTLTDGLADARAALADARAFAAQLPTLLSRIEPGLDNVSSAMQAIDPEAISTIIGNVRDVSATLYEARGDIDTVVATAGDVARRVNAVTEAIANRTDEISGIIDNVSNVSHQLVAAAPQIDTVLTSANATLTAIREAVGSVDVTAVNQIISDVRTVASTVGSRAGEIGSAIDSAVAAARDFADELGSNGEGDGAIKEIIDRARRISVNLEVASQKIDGVVDHASDLFNGPVQSLVAGVDSAATSIGDVAAAFAPRAGQIANGLSRFSQSGLDDLRALINQGRSTLGTIESAVSSFNRDPSRVIFGGSDGPRYTPQRR